MIRIAMWSGPRNISTAMMRSWENRGDCVVVDEPLYAHYLSVTGLDHPAAQRVVAAGDTDWRRVTERLTNGTPGDATVFYQKHMTHHLLPHIGHDWIRRLRNVLLIRDPREVVASYLKSRATVTPEDTGLPQQVALYRMLSQTGTPPPVIDAADFLREPERQLRAICDLLGVPFTERMLSWPAGPGIRTGSGPRTGTRPSGVPPGSNRTGHATRGFTASRPGPPRNACPTTNGCTRSGSDPDPMPRRRLPVWWLSRFRAPVLRNPGRSGW
jgi:hypothetical protein